MKRTNAPPNAGRPIVPPVVFSSTYAFDSTAELIAESGRLDSNFYSRYSNPTVRAAEGAIAALEGAELSLCFSSGMAAISSALLGHLKQGDRILAQSAIYGGTQGLMTKFLPRWGIETDFMTPEKLLADFDRIRRPAHKLLYLESPVNPLIQLVDLRALSAKAHRAGMRVMVDATFATPLLQNSLGLGADLVMHSTTKGLGGHSDLIGGVVSGSRKLMLPLWEARKSLGGSMEPMTAYLLWRGMQTLTARLARQQATALKVAKVLRANKKIKFVSYPGLPDFPQRELWKKQMRGAGTMMAFDCGGSLKQTAAAVDRLRLILNATSLGGTESLVSLPAITSHVSFKPSDRIALGITDGLVRFSIGMEEPAELVADLKQAFRI